MPKHAPNLASQPVGQSKVAYHLASQPVRKSQNALNLASQPVSPKQPLGAQGPGILHAYFPSSSVPALRPREGDGSHLRDHAEWGGFGTPSSSGASTLANSQLPPSSCLSSAREGRKLEHG